MWWDEPTWRIGLRARRLEGELVYRGRSQIGLPIRTRTRLEITEAALEARWLVVDAGPVVAALEAAGGVRRIDRHILASLRSTPLTEVMRRNFVQFGARAGWTPASGWLLAASARVEHSIGDRLHVDPHGYADPVTVRPGHGYGHSIGLGIDRRINRWLTVGFHADRSRHRYGASDWHDFTRGGATIGQVQYPGSVQRFDTLRIALEANWD